MSLNAAGRTLSTGVLAIFAAIVLAGCSFLPGLATSSNGAGDEVGPAVANRSPGSLVEAKPFSDVDQSIKNLGATAIRILYRSTSGTDGSSTEVSAAVFVPAGKPPKGGWPVVAFAHGATG